jgi:Family of unknown function (DUF6220)
LTRALRSIWSVLLTLFLAMIPIQFYLAGHGAMEGSNVATHVGDKGIHISRTIMSTAWDPHAIFGTLMLLVSLLILLVAFGARLPRRLLGMTAGLFVLMVIQAIVLGAFNDSSSTRWIAAIHPVNALLIIGLAISLMVRGREYSPIARVRSMSGEPVATGS